MTILERIDNDLITAMKARRMEEMTALRLLKSILKNKTIELGKEVTDEIAVVTLRQQAKKHKDSITAFKEGNRSVLAEREEQQLKVLEQYIPSMMPEAEVNALVAKAITDNPGAAFGQLMKQIIAESQGRADNSLVSALLKAKLSP
ncbi:MAG: GatB/YqeY domain-containing protein [bacterium]